MKEMNNCLLGNDSTPIRRADCLNTFRLLAAFEVLYGHSMFHLNILDDGIFGWFIHYFHGVPIFFTLSGFLMCGSILSSKSYLDYLKKRFWRIYPELWLAVLLEVIVLLALYHHPISWGQFSLFVFGQSTFFQFWTPDCLRDYGCGCPNGALWTITVLVQFYIVAYPLYKYMHGKRLSLWILFLLIALGISCLTPSIQSFLSENMGKLYGISLFPFLWMFLMALLFGEYKEKILPTLKKYWYIFVITTLFVEHIGIDYRASYPILGTSFLILSIIGFAYSFPAFNIKMDISYGVYIYHMTIVNALIALGYLQKWYLLGVVISITVILAWLSTKTVGQWGLKKKHK